MTDTKRKITLKSLSEDIGALQEQVKQIEPLKKKLLDMESIVEILKGKLKYYEDKENESTSPNKKENIYKCKFCEELFVDKKVMKGHIKLKHPRKLNCEECDMNFTLNIDLEVHLESHQKPKMFQCKICDKEFHLMWRLSKHLTSHETSLKFCHYYNNDKFCPFEANGCKFAHFEAPSCKFKRHCGNNLCQFTHKNTTHGEQNQSGKTVDHETLLTTNLETAFNNLEDNIDIEEIVDKKNEVKKCKSCKVDIPTGKKSYKCEECDCFVCKTCSKKTFVEEDYFMCIDCM